jgi:hypothetical protein
VDDGDDSINPDAGGYAGALGSFPETSGSGTGNFIEDGKGISLPDDDGYSGNGSKNQHQSISAPNSSAAGPSGSEGSPETGSNRSVDDWDASINPDAGGYAGAEGSFPETSGSGPIATRNFIEDGNGISLPDDDGYSGNGYKNQHQSISAPNSSAAGSGDSEGSPETGSNTSVDDGDTSINPDAGALGSFPETSGISQDSGIGSLEFADSINTSINSGNEIKEEKELGEER